MGKKKDKDDGFHKVSFDGKSWAYRDPNNYEKKQKARENWSGRGNDPGARNPDSYEQFDGLYRYSEGAVSDAAKALGYTNINSKGEVKDILEYLRSPKIMDDGGGKKKKKKNKEPEPYEGPSFNVSDEDAEAELNAIKQRVKDYEDNQHTIGDQLFGVNDEPSVMDASGFTTGISDAQGFKDDYAFNVKQAIGKAGLKTRGPGINQIIR